MQFESDQWPLSAALLIQDAIDSVLHDKGQCSVMLTGGNSAERLYTSWNQLPRFKNMRGVRFYFSDERCVPVDHLASNYGMVQRTLFKRGMLPGCSLCRMVPDDPDPEAAARKYDKALPNSVDVLLLGIGEDGHIASLFPGGSALQEARRRVVSVIGPKPPCERITITPIVIAQASSIFVLAPGEAKARVLSETIKSAGGPDTMPTSLVLGAIWLVDTKLQG